MEDESAQLSERPCLLDELSAERPEVGLEVWRDAILAGRRVAELPRRGEGCEDERHGLEGRPFDDAWGRC